MEINQALILSTTRSLFYGFIKCEPDNVDACWVSLSDNEKEHYIKIATEWLHELKIRSPKTFDYVESNYDEIKFG